MKCFNFGSLRNCCALSQICCDPNSQRNRLRTEDPVNKTERVKSLRTLIDCGSEEENPCELNLRTESLRSAITQP